MKNINDPDWPTTLIAITLGFIVVVYIFLSGTWYEKSHQTILSPLPCTQQ